MTPPLSVEQIIWRRLTAQEIEAIAIARGAARIAIEYLWPIAAASAIRECERHNHTTHGTLFQTEFGDDIAAMFRTAMRRVHAEQAAGHNFGRFVDAA